MKALQVWSDSIEICLYKWRYSFNNNLIAEALSCSFLSTNWPGCTRASAEMFSLIASGSKSSFTALSYSSLPLVSTFEQQGEVNFTKPEARNHQSGECLQKVRVSKAWCKFWPPSSAYLSGAPSQVMKSSCVSLKLRCPNGVKESLRRWASATIAMALLPSQSRKCNTHHSHHEWVLRKS